MKRIRFILTAVLSLLLTTAWADGTGGNDNEDVKSLSKILLMDYVLEDANVEDLPTPYPGYTYNSTDGYKKIYPNDIGWPSTSSTAISQSSNFKLHLVASRTDNTLNWNTNGSVLLCSRDNPLSDYNVAFKLYQCAGTTGAFRYVQNKAGLDFTTTGGKIFDVTIEREGSNNCVVVMATIDGVPQEAKKLDHTIMNQYASSIPFFTYALPVGFNINEISVKPSALVKASAVENGSVSSMTINGKLVDLSYTCSSKTSYPMIVNGETLVLTATPDQGYKIKEWQNGNGTVLQTGGNTYSYTKNDDTTGDYVVKAVFEEDTYAPITFDGNSNNITWIKDTSKHYLVLIKDKSNANEQTLYEGDNLTQQYHLLKPKTDPIIVKKGQPIKIYWKSAAIAKGQMRLNAYCDLDGDKELEWHYTYRDPNKTSPDDVLITAETDCTIEIPTTNAVEGLTLVRIRLDSGDAAGETAGNSPTAECNRHAYEIYVDIQPTTGHNLNVTHDWHKGTVSAKVKLEGSNEWQTYTEFPVSVPENATVQLTATPDPLNKFNAWKEVPEEGEATTVCETATYTFTMGTTDKTFTAIVEGYDRPETEAGKTEDEQTDWARQKFMYFSSLTYRKYDEATKTSSDVQFYSVNDNDLYHPFNFANGIDNAIEVEQGKPIIINWQMPSGWSINRLFLSAFADLDMDKNFTCYKDYKHKESGTYDSGTFEGTGTISIPTKYSPLGYTRVRLRIDSSTKDNKNYDDQLGYFPSDCVTDRYVYDIIVKIVDRKTAFLDVACENGSVTAEVTPIGGTATTYNTFPQDIEFGSKVVLNATVTDPANYEFVKWTDEYGNRISGKTPTLTYDNIGNEDVICQAVIEGMEGEHAIKCKAGYHDWNIHFKAWGQVGTIQRISLKAKETAEKNGETFTPDFKGENGNCCVDGCEVVIPSVVTDDQKAEADRVNVTLEQVSTTIVHGEHALRKLELPSTISEIKRSREISLNGRGEPLKAEDLPTGNDNITPGHTHALSGATKWKVDPVIKSDEEWWFVGVFDFKSDVFSLTNKTDAEITQDITDKYPGISDSDKTQRENDAKNFRDWGCALLTTRLWPSQRNDDWSGRFQIWVDGKGAADSGDKKRTTGDIRLVNSQRSANNKGDFLYFTYKTTDETTGETIDKNINVMGENKIVRFEVHNYPNVSSIGNKLVYTIQVYEKDETKTNNMGRLLQEGEIVTDVEGFENIDWVSNFAPTSDVECLSLKFHRPATNMMTYRDDVEPSTEFTPTVKQTVGEKTVRTINLKNKLLTDEDWIIAVHYIPQGQADEVILSAGAANAHNADIDRNINDGFRIVQKAGNENIYFQWSGSNNNVLFQNINITKREPLTFIVYHYADGTMAVSATDRLNRLIERLEIPDPNVVATSTDPDDPAAKKAIISADIAQLQTDCGYKTHKYDVTVATVEHTLFANCPILENIKLNNTDNYIDIDGAIYDKTGTTLVLWPEGKVIPCEDSEFHVNGDHMSVESSKYATDEVIINLPENVKKIAPLAFMNVRDDKVKHVAVNVDDVDEIERLSYVNGAITYVTTPKHFLEMERNDQISFRLRLMQNPQQQDLKDSQYLDYIMNEFNYGIVTHDGEDNTAIDPVEPRSYTQISLPDRFDGANPNNWNTFAVPFNITESDVREHFAKVYKLTGAEVNLVNNGNRELKLLFSKIYDETDGTTQSENSDPVMIAAGVPHIVKVKSNLQTVHTGEVRFKYSPFNITVDENVEPVQRIHAKNNYNTGYDYYVSMKPNYDPTDVDGTYSGKPDAVGNYEYTYILSSNNLRQVKSGVKTHNNGYRGYFKIYAEPNTSNPSPAPLLSMSMMLTDDGEATAIIDVNADDDVNATNVYSLSGILLGNSIDDLPVGIYIINNKKVLKR